jgi:electron transport complex protein RnfG
MKGKKLWIIVGILGAITLTALIFELINMQNRFIAPIEDVKKANEEAKDMIEEIDRENCRAAIAEALQITDPSIKEVESTEEQEKTAEKFDAKLLQIYEVPDGSEQRYALKVSSSGSQGTIVMMVGFDKDGRISGVSVVSHSETSGIGTKVVGNESTVSGVGALDQYRGKSAEDYPLKIGKGIDAVSGATVTGKGITKGVNAAIAVFQLLKQ